MNSSTTTIEDETPFVRKDLSQLITSMFALTNAAQRMTDQPSAAAAPPSMSPLLAETRDLRMSCRDDVRS